MADLQTARSSLLQHKVKTKCILLEEGSGLKQNRKDVAMTPGALLASLTAAFAQIMRKVFLAPSLTCPSSHHDGLVAAEVLQAELGHRYLPSLPL